MSKRRMKVPQFPRCRRKPMTEEGKRLVHTIRTVLNFRTALQRLEEDVDVRFEQMYYLVSDIERVEAEHAIVEALLGRKRMKKTTTHGLLVIADRIRLMNRYREIQTDPACRDRSVRQAALQVREESIHLAPTIGECAERTLYTWIDNWNEKDASGLSAGVQSLLGIPGKVGKGIERENPEGFERSS